MTTNPSAARWASALKLLRWVESRSDVPRGWRARPYRVEGSHAVRDSVRGHDLSRPVSGMARKVPSDAARISARCRADVVRLGKFDIDEVTRFRAFHVTEVTQGSALRVQGQADGGAPGVERDVAARRHVARHAPDLAPPLLEHGIHRRKGVAYLREGIVAGRHPRGPDEVQRLVPPMLAQLARLYAGVGVERQRLSSVVSSRLPQRWEAVASTHLVPSTVADTVRALLARDALVEVSLGHGDLVRTNLLVVDDDVVLLDWEHARSMPIAFDLAKPVFLSRAPDLTIQAMGERLPGLVARSADSYRLEEQLALALVQMLSWSVVRAARAAAAGRTHRLQRDTVARAALLERLVD